MKSLVTIGCVMLFGCTSVTTARQLEAAMKACEKHGGLMWITSYSYSNWDDKFHCVDKSTFRIGVNGEVMT